MGDHEEPWWLHVLLSPSTSFHTNKRLVVQKFPAIPQWIRCRWSKGIFESNLPIAYAMGGVGRGEAGYALFVGVVVGVVAILW